MNKKFRAYGLNNENVKAMTETERNILVSILKIELSRFSMNLEDLDLSKLKLSEEQKEILQSLLKEES